MTEGKHFNLTVWVDRKPVDVMRPLDDPLVLVTVDIGWRDVVRAAWRRRGIQVRMDVNADREGLRQLFGQPPLVYVDAGPSNSSCSCPVRSS